MSAPLFECADEYESQLAQGTWLSGEDRHFFIRGRVADLLGRLPAGFRPHRVLDFGCGLGDTSRRLGDVFPEAQVLGVDTAVGAIAWARAHHAGERVSFDGIDALPSHGHFDLCYANGVIHHVSLDRRAAMFGAIRAALRPGGFFGVFENNPWNPGARMVMRRIPFDRDAIPVSPRQLRSLLRAHGFRIIGARSLFWFPRPLAVLRPLERVLAPLPLGAQHWVLATTSDDR